LAYDHFLDVIFIIRVYAQSYKNIAWIASSEILYISRILFL